MSLWRQRRAIERAVAGQLEPQDDAKLRAHLRGCVECRRFYDQLTVHARILAGDPHATAASAERELARLMGTLAPAVPAPARPWWPTLAVAAALAAAVLFFVVPRAEKKDDIVWRGTATERPAGFGVWLVTAPQDGGELRRDVTFPGGAATVHAQEWVAFSVAQSPKPVVFFRAVLVNERGQTLVLASGKSVALDPGKWRAFAVASPDATGPDEAVLSAAAKKATLEGRALELPGYQASGVITVLP